jgi:hypothetical protein
MTPAHQGSWHLVSSMSDALHSANAMPGTLVVRSEFGASSKRIVRLPPYGPSQRRASASAAVDNG